MNIYKVIGRNLEITDAMRTYTEEKLQKLDRFSDQIVDAKVVMSYASHGKVAEPARVEVQVNIPQGIVRAEESGPDTYIAVDRVLEKLERQLKRFKGRQMSRRSEGAPVYEEPVSTVDEPSLVRTKRHVLRPMTPEDAALQMEALGHNFFMFNNSETGLVSVIYLRQDGNYGLLEPANP
jgi:putative sigma-54 modulation protein